MRVLGFMTGTSLDAVDMAVIETDGEVIQGFGPAGERNLSEPLRDLLLEATAEALKWKRGEPEPAVFGPARVAVAEEHLAAGAAFLDAHGLTWRDFDLLGVHGQTVLHERPAGGILGRTVQLVDAGHLARATGRPVASDFRSADMAAGGQGAPLAPVYHLARIRAADLRPPLAVLNVGGVANITFIDHAGGFSAFDTGPGNGMLDLMVQARGLGRYDAGGELARAGAGDQAVLERLLSHAYFSAPPPKSLDRYDFPLDAVEGLTATNAAATLVAFMAQAVRRAFEHAPERPRAVVVCGGGRRNPEIMLALQAALPVPVSPAEVFGWRGDAIEAEATAYLAARTLNGLPLSFPATTGVTESMTGGRIARP